MDRPSAKAFSLTLGGASPAAAFGRRQRLGELYVDTAPRLLRFLEHRCHDPELAEDLTAEVYTRAWTSLRDLSNADAATAWLFRTARNLAIDHSRRGQTSVALSDLNEVADPATTTTETALDLKQMLSRLPPREHEAIVLRFVIGLRNREIAGVVGTTEGNVAKRIHRGLKRLRSLTETEDRSSR